MFDQEQAISFFLFPVNDTFELSHVLHYKTEGEQAGSHRNDRSDSTELGKHVSNVVIMFCINVLSEIHS